MDSSPEITGATAQILRSLSYPLHPWAIKNQLPGAAICCQNAPVGVAILHKAYIKLQSYICCELSFKSYFPCFRNKYFKENRSLCVLTLLCSGNIELYFENYPWLVCNCPWFMPNPREQGTILKCKLPLVLVDLFQGLSGLYDLI